MNILVENRCEFTFRLYSMNHCDDDNDDPPNAWHYNAYAQTVRECTINLWARKTEKKKIKTKMELQWRA